MKCSSTEHAPGGRRPCVPIVNWAKLTPLLILLLPLFSAAGAAAKYVRKIRKKLKEVHTQGFLPLRAQSVSNPCCSPASPFTKDAAFLAELAKKEADAATKIQASYRGARTRTLSA